MPVFQRDPQGRRLLGYMPLNFFAPHAQYASTQRDDELRIEFKNMVKAFIRPISRGAGCCVQPHLRRGLQGADLQLQGARQCRLLHVSVRPGESLRELFRPGQYIKFRAGARCADGELTALRYWKRGMISTPDSASISRRYSAAMRTDRSTGAEAPIFREIAADPEFRARAFDRKSLGYSRFINLGEDSRASPGCSGTAGSR